MKSLIVLFALTFAVPALACKNCDKQHADSAMNEGEGRMPASVVTEEFKGTFTSPPHDPSDILIEGKNAVTYMKSRWLWGKKGELKKRTMSVVFTCESDERCTLAFPKN